MLLYQIERNLALLKSTLTPAASESVTPMPLPSSEITAATLFDPSAEPFSLDLQDPPPPFSPPVPEKSTETASPAGTLDVQLTPDLNERLLTLIAETSPRTVTVGVQLTPDLNERLLAYLSTVPPKTQTKKSTVIVALDGFLTSKGF